MGIFIKKETRSQSSQNSDLLVTSLPQFINLNQSFTSAKAIENSDIWSAINIIASDIASLDLEYHLKNVKQDDDNFSYLLNIKPNSFYNGYTLKFVIIANILLNGESFIELVRDDNNKIIEMYHVKNSQITYKQDKSTNYELVYDIKINNDKSRRVTADDILHFKFFSTDGIKGVSPLISLKDDMETQQNSKRFLNNFFKQGFSSSGILTFKGGKLSKEAREKMKEEWQKANSGTDQSHKVVVLDETMEFEKLEIDTEILKLINTSNFSTEQIAKTFKIPRHKLGLETSNMKLEEMNNSYIVNTLNPYLNSLSSEINFKLCCHSSKNSSYQFNVDAFKFVDIETKTKVTKDKLSFGMISLNEARKDFGMEQINNEMFDKHYINLNHVPLETLADYQLNKMKHNPNKTLKGGDVEDE